MGDERPHEQSGGAASAMENAAYEDEDDDYEPEAVAISKVEKYMRELVRHRIDQTPDGLSEGKMACLELYVMRYKEERLTGKFSSCWEWSAEKTPTYALVFNRDMSAMELKKELDKVGGEKFLTGKAIPLSADSETVREIQSCAGVDSFQALFHTQNASEYSFPKAQWEPFFRAVGVDFSPMGVAALYDRDIDANKDADTVSDRGKARELVVLYDPDKKSVTEVDVLYERDVKNADSVERRVIIEYIREKKFAFINRDAKVTNKAELYRYTEDGHDYIIWSIELDHQKNFIVYSMDNEGNIVARAIDRNIPVDEWEKRLGRRREPMWD